MAIINIQTPDGIQRVQIEGDAPTDEESLRIRQQFFKPSVEEFDITKASLEEIRQQTGVSGTTTTAPRPGPTNPGEIDSPGFRYNYGKADWGEDGAEKIDYIEKIFGKGTAIVFGPHDLGLDLDKVTTELKEEYDLPPTGTIRVNQPGLTTMDILDFGGAYRGPLVATTVASIFTGGMPLWASALTIGLSAAAGHGIDEVQEEIQGVQQQDWVAPADKDSVAKEMVIEALLMGSGEFILRPLFSLIGRTIRGPGPAIEQDAINRIIAQGAARGVKVSERQATRLAQEEARAIAHKQILAGARPTIEAATGKTMVGRLQAIYDAMIPNRGAVRANQKYLRGLAEEFQLGRLSEEELLKSINTQAGVITNAIAQSMKDPAVAVKEANRRLQEVITKSIEEVSNHMAGKTGRGTKAIAEDFATQISQATRLFRETTNQLYELAGNNLSSSAVYDPLMFKPLLNQLTGMTFKQDIISPVLQSKSLKSLANWIKTNDQIAKIKTKPFKRLNPQEKQLLEQYPQGRLMTFRQLNDLRINLNALKGSQDMIGGTEAGAILQKFTDTITKTLNQREKMLQGALNRAGGVAVQGQKGFVAKDVVQRQQDGYELLRHANRIYGEGMDQYSKGNIKVLLSRINEGFFQDIKAINNAVIKEGEPQLLKSYLNAVTPPLGSGIFNRLNVPVLRELASLAENGQVKTFNEVLAKSGMQSKLVRPFDDVTLGSKPTSPYFNNIVNEQAQYLRQLAVDVEQKATPNIIRNEMRSVLANQWIRDTLKSSETAGVIQVKDFATKYNALGREVQDVLFGKADALTLREIAKDAFLHGSDEAAFRALNPNLISNATLQQNIATLRGTLNLADQQAESSLLQAIKTGTVVNGESLVTALIKKPDQLKPLMEQYARLNSKVPTTLFDEMGGLKDIVMMRIMKEAFPDGINSEVITTGGFGKGMEKAIRALDSKGPGLAQILGNGNEAAGKLVLNDLKKFAQAGTRVTNYPFKGKAGLAPAVFLAGAVGAFWAGPVGFAGTVAGIYMTGRLLRNRRFLQWLTSPQSSARLRSIAERVGVDIGDDRAFSVVGLESLAGYKGISEQYMPLWVRELINREARIAAIYAGQQEIGETADIAEEQISKTPAGETIRTGFEQIRAGVPDVRASLSNIRGSDVLREVERDKLIGVR